MTERRRKQAAWQRSVLARRAANRWFVFARRYGWRAYAVPILAVITIAALARGVASPAAQHLASHRPVDQHTTAVRNAAVQVEGLTNQDAGFDAGATPTPVVIHLGNDAVSCATNTFKQLVLVSISKQHLWACEGNRQVDSTPVTTGRSQNHDQTPVGSWRVQAKERDRYLVGPGYRDYVKYWVPFNGDFGLHDASWQTMPFGSKDYKQRGSHGCVHLPTPTMAWLYRWVGIGDTVVTVVS